MAESSHSGETAARQDLLINYPFAPDSFDEMCSAPGTLRPHWQSTLHAFSALGGEELGRREHEVRQVLRENGVTYNVYTNAQERERPWALDVIPVLITSQEWRTIERGLIQCAELLNLILADVYGPQKIMRKGLLPPELVYSHPGFLRPCHASVASHTRHLYLYAADLARAPDGGIWVLGDRTQAPSGAGYALENRLVLSRVLPSLYRDAQVHRLSLFFRALHATLTALLPPRQPEVRIALFWTWQRNLFRTRVSGQLSWLYVSPR